MEKPIQFLQKHYGKNAEDQRQLITEIPVPRFKMEGKPPPKVPVTGRKCVKVYMKGLY
jgi:hypothetical protein